MSGVPLSEVLSPNGPGVEIRWYDSVDDERDLVDDVLRTLSREGLSPSRTVVLSRYRLDGSAMSAAPNVVDVSRGAEHDGLDGIRFSTIASFKGSKPMVSCWWTSTTSSPMTAWHLCMWVPRARRSSSMSSSRSERNRFQQLAKEFGRTLIERSR